MAKVNNPRLSGLIGVAEPPQDEEDVQEEQNHETEYSTDFLECQGCVDNYKILCYTP